jgi:CelD/BcsL family acetyltransferase involved in cellulose biosynthesis
LPTRDNVFATGWDVAEIADTAAAARRREIAFAPLPDDARRHAGGAARLCRLDALAPDRWRALGGGAVEPNGYFLPEWELAVDAFSPGRTGVRALTATGNDGADLIGLLPVVSAWHALRLPLPALVSADPFGTLATPLLHRDRADDAADGLMRQARAAGAHALVLRDIPLAGPAMTAFARALAAEGLRPHVLYSQTRAWLDATRDSGDVLHDALGAKKLRRLQRQRNRLADHGEVVFAAATTPDDAARALEIFLALEAGGWKGRRGTALANSAGNAAFIRHAVRESAARGACEIVTLHAGATPVAAAIVPRHLDRAFYFKIGIDERFAQFSPGVQLTLDLTRYLCADAAIRTVDSMAPANHPMIDPIWRGRFAIGDVLIPLRRRDPLVPAIRAALGLRRLARGAVRRVAHGVRQLRNERR